MTNYTDKRWRFTAERDGLGPFRWWWTVRDLDTLNGFSGFAWSAAGAARKARREVERHEAHEALRAATRHTEEWS